MKDLCIRDLVERVGGRLRLGSLPPLGGELEPIRRIVMDSRKATAGDVFWGLVGRTHDGSRFAEEAFGRGALGAVVSDRRLEPWGGTFSLEVANTRVALWQLACAMRRRFIGQVVAITGLGSTAPTARLVHAVLRTCRQGSLRWCRPDSSDSLPLTLVNLDDAADYVILGLQATTVAQFGLLVELCSPQIVVIPSGTQMLDGAGTSKPTIVRIAREMFSACPNVRHVILDGDDHELRKLVGPDDSHVVWVGCGSHCDVSASNIVSCNGMLSLMIDGISLGLPLTGRHWVKAVLCAFAVGRLLNMPPREIAVGLRQFRVPSKRGELVVAQHRTTMDRLTQSKMSNIDEAQPIASITREVDATLPPG